MYHFGELAWQNVDIPPDPHKHGDQAAAGHPGQVPHRAPGARGREGEGAAGHILAPGQGGRRGQVVGHRVPVLLGRGAGFHEGYLRDASQAVASSIFNFG